VIGRGRHRELYLYEVTEQDLLLGHDFSVEYRPGNVLIFADKRAVELGAELARADDMSAALEFLDQDTSIDPAALITANRRAPIESSDSDITAAFDYTELLRQREEDIQHLSECIDQRDELLRDISESLKIQQQDNELLVAMLESTREQLAEHELSQSELVDDLQLVSVEAMSRENALEQALAEKFQLEQELAERITELLELNLQNDELRFQLDVDSLVADAATIAGTTPILTDDRPDDGKLSDRSESTNGTKTSDNTDIRKVSTLLDTAAPKTHTSPDVGPDDSAAHVVTVSSGKQIHIYHEFPPATHPGVGARFGSALTSLLQIVLIVVGISLILVAVSTFATAQVNGISLGEALNLLIKSLLT
jgi:hypothetical protein